MTLLSIFKGLLLIAPKDDVRYFLNGVLVAPGTLSASDGFRAVIVKCPTPLSEGEVVLCRKDLANKIKCFSAKADIVLRVSPSVHLQELDASGRDVGAAVGLATVDGRYPDIGRAVNRTRLDAIAEQGFDLKLMASTCTAVSTIVGGGKWRGAKFELYGPLYAARITAGDVTAYLMPAKV